LVVHYYARGHGFSVALPWSHHFSVRAPRGRNDILLALQGVEVNDAVLKLKPDRYQIKSSGHIIEVRPETDLLIYVDKLVLSIPQPPPVSSQSPTASPKGRVRVEVALADFKTRGQVMVAVDQFPAVRFNDISVNARPTDPADVSAEVLFTRAISAMLTDIVDAPLDMSEPVQRDFRPETVSVRSATLSLRPGATIRLPLGREMTIGEASQIHIADLHFDASQSQTWRGKVDLDIGLASPSEFAAGKLVINPGTARVAMALDVTLDKEEWTASLIAAPAKQAKVALTGGSLNERAHAWEGKLKSADIDIEALKFTSSRRGDHPAFDCRATLTADSQIHWDRDSWRGSADLLINKLKITVTPAAAGARPAAQFVAGSDQQTILRNLIFERDVGGGLLRLSLDELIMSGEMSNALALNAALAHFHASGGRVSYKGRDGTIVSADFAAGGSLNSNVDFPGPTGKPAPAVFALKGKAKTIDLTTPKNDKLHLQNVDLDIKAAVGPSPAVSLTAGGDLAVLSDRIAFSGGRAAITSLELHQATAGGKGKLQGHVGLTFSVPKNQLIDEAQKELAKPISIPGKHIGKVLEADVSLSDLRVDARGLKVGFNGPKLHVEGPLVITGKLETKRRIVVDVPLAGRVEKHTSHHDDFTLHARLSANAIPAFPTAADLASQTLEMQFEYQKATLELGGVLGKLPLANDVFKDMLKLFGIESKIKSALPKKTTVALFKTAKSDPKSMLNKIRNPQIALSITGDQLVLSGKAEIEY
jgi:hypothetical protein